VSVTILKELGPQEPGVQGSAEAGNRTRGLSMATRDFTTKPLLQSFVELDDVTEGTFLTFIQIKILIAFHSLVVIRRKILSWSCPGRLDVLHVPLHLPTNRDDLPNMAGACPSMAYDLASLCLRTLTNKLLRYSRECTRGALARSTMLLPAVTVRTLGPDRYRTGSGGPPVRVALRCGGSWVASVLL
jgi:hypothetical protein